MDEQASNPDWLHEDHRSDADVDALVQPTIENLARWYLQALESVAEKPSETEEMVKGRDDSRDFVFLPIRESSKEASIMSTMTTTHSRTLPDGSVETKRVLKRRFADGREEKEESHDVSKPEKLQSTISQLASAGDNNKSIKAKTDQGWFWN